MLASVVFNRILDGRLPAQDLEGKVVAFATHIQRDEIASTPDVHRREALMRVFANSLEHPTSTTSFVALTMRNLVAKE